MKNEYTVNTVSILGLIISLIGIFITTYFQFKDPQTGNLLFLGILVFVVVYFIVSYVVGKFNQVNKNTFLIIELKKDLNNLKDDFNMIRDVSKLEARTSFLENILFKMKNKRGQIDPRWVIILIILILLFFYLRSKGII